MRATKAYEITIEGQDGSVEERMNLPHFGAVLQEMRILFSGFGLVPGSIYDLGAPESGGIVELENGKTIRISPAAE